MKKVILFDYGHTLVDYPIRAEDPEFLKKLMAAVADVLRVEGLLTADQTLISERARAENVESEDHRVTPLVERLCRIFEVDEDSCTPELTLALSRAWLQPVFDVGRIYEDTLPVLRKIRAQGVQTAIVSNTPWGSPGDLWREEVRRHGLDTVIDAMFFCTDVGWRKPARQILDYAMEKLGVGVQDCLFVGDNPKWDIEGPRSISMDAVLLDRHGRYQEPDSIRTLYELETKL